MTPEYLYPFATAALSRLHGSQIKIPKVWDGLLYATPYALCSHLVTGNWLITAAVLGVTAAAKNTPHEAFLGKPDTAQRLTWLTKITDFIAGSKRDRWSWMATGWSVKGLLICLPLALSLVHYDVLKATQVVAFGMVGYAIAYHVGNRYLRQGNTWGEALGGFIVGWGLV